MESGFLDNLVSQQMHPLYSWQCFVCEASNPAGADACHECGFPAKATGREIASARIARTSGAKPSPIKDTSAFASIAEALRPLSIWRKALAILGGALLFGGMIWFKIAFSLAEVAWSIAAVISGFGAVALAYATASAECSAKSDG